MDQEFCFSISTRRFATKSIIDLGNDPVDLGFYRTAQSNIVPNVQYQYKYKNFDCGWIVWLRLPRQNRDSICEGFIYLSIFAKFGRTEHISYNYSQTNTHHRSHRSTRERRISAVVLWCQFRRSSSISQRIARARAVQSRIRWYLLAYVFMLIWRDSCSPTKQRS